jgi:hypothetical protein
MAIAGKDIAGREHGSMSRWHRRNDVEVARGTPQYLADIVCVANVVAKSERGLPQTDFACWKRA